MIVPENKNQKIHRVFIKLDEEKINKNNPNQYESLCEIIDNSAKRCKLSLNKDGWYEGTSDQCDTLIVALLGINWFLENVKEWKRWDVERNSIENGIEIYKKIGVL